MSGDEPTVTVAERLRPEQITAHVHPQASRHSRPRWDVGNGWPLVAIFAGMPLWWILGLVQLIFVVMVVPMLMHLARQRVLLPRGFALWALFLVWVLGGVLVLQVDAPDAVPGESSGRYLTFAVRVAWYTIAAIVLLYVVNTRASLSTARISSAVSWMFLVLVAGGLLGMVAPDLSIPSALEVVLPQSLTANPTVNNLIHPQTAQLHTFLGYVEPRPSAPFAYTNEWGLAIALTAPFFVASWWGRGPAWRAGMILLLAVAALPVTSSLNRGLWGALLVMALFVVVRAALRGNLVVLGGLLVGGLLAAALILSSPLGELVSARLDTPHSNEGRGNLSALSVQSAAEGSPLVGFGTTRDVQGNFNSIAGGDSALCLRCSPPPLGTQGQLWLLIFGSGFVGAALYLAFFAAQLPSALRASSRFEVAAMCSLIGLFVTMPVYNNVGVGLFIAMIAVGVLSRPATAPSRRTLAALVAPARTAGGFILVIAVSGGLIGLGLHAALGSPARAAQSVAVPGVDLVGVPDIRPLSLDSEASVLKSTTVLEAVATALPGENDLTDIERSLEVTARPNSRILNITYMARDETQARVGAEIAAAAYLTYRDQLAEEARVSISERYSAQQKQLEDNFVAAAETVNTADGPPNPSLAERTNELRLLAANARGIVQTAESTSGTGSQIVSDVQVVPSTDLARVRVTSGGMTGLVFGLMLAPWVHGARLTGRGGRPSWDTDQLPLVDTVRLGADGAVSRDAVARARSMLAPYAPLCCLVTSEGAPVSPGVIRRLESATVAADGPPRGNCAVLVLRSDAHARALRTAIQECRTAGLVAVGVLLVDPPVVPRSD